MQLDIDEYLDEPLEMVFPNDHFNIISWGKMNEHKYPIFSKIVGEFVHHYSTSFDNEEEATLKLFLKIILYTFSDFFLKKKKSNFKMIFAIILS